MGELGKMLQTFRRLSRIKLRWGKIFYQFVSFTKFHDVLRVSLQLRKAGLSLRIAAYVEQLNGVDEFRALISGMRNDKKIINNK